METETIKNVDSDFTTYYEIQVSVYHICLGLLVFVVGVSQMA